MVWPKLFETEDKMEDTDDDNPSAAVWAAEQVSDEEHAFFASTTARLALRKST